MALVPDQTVFAKSNLTDTSSKTRRLAVKNLEEGRGIKTMVGDGRTMWDNVANISYKNVDDMPIVKIITSQGSFVRATPDHKIFAHLPKAEKQLSSGNYYVYLMNDGNGRWRIGMSTNIQSRLSSQTKASYVIPIDNCESEERMRANERIYSMKYDIPQLSFNTSEIPGSVNEDYVQGLIHNGVDYKLDDIEQDFGISLDYPAEFKSNRTRKHGGHIMVRILDGTNYSTKLNVFPADGDEKEVGNIDSLNPQEGPSAPGTWYEIIDSDWNKYNESEKKL